MVMKTLIVALCVSLTAAAPWPFSMWRSSQLETSAAGNPLPEFYHTTKSMEDQVNSLVGQCEGLTVDYKRDGDTVIQFADYVAPGTPGPPAQIYKTMVVGGEHAREMIGSELALNFVKALCGQAASKDIEEAKKNTMFRVVMNPNPGSRAQVEQGDFCKRVNPNGVDINRNFDVDFANADTDNAETNPGKAAFDQPESRIMRELMKDFQPHAYLDVHSGFRGMFFPNAVAEDKELSMKLQRLVAPVDEAHCKCPLGVANEQVGYHTSGSALDYSYQKMGIPFSMAMEVYIDENEKQDIKELEDRWNSQKTNLLKPLSTEGSAFLQNGIAPNPLNFPMQFIQRSHEKEAQLDRMSPAYCMKFFNPIHEHKFKQVLSGWTNALAELSIKSKEIPVKKGWFAFQDKAAEEALQEVPNLTIQEYLSVTKAVQVSFDKMAYDRDQDGTLSDEEEERAMKAKADILRAATSKVLEQRAIRKQAERDAEWTPFWLTVKILGFLLVCYLGLKYFKVQQARREETDESKPLGSGSQMAPIQVSD